MKALFKDLYERMNSVIFLAKAMSERVFPDVTSGKCSVAGSAFHLEIHAKLGNIKLLWNGGLDNTKHV